MAFVCHKHQHPGHWLVQSQLIYNNKMQSEHDKNKFTQAELSLGLRKQFFDAKFVYSQQQASDSNNAYFIDLFKQFPSQTHGFSQQDVQQIHAFAGQVMRQAALSLALPVSTLIVAQTLFHFFYARKSYLEHDIRDIMMGCIYLACKSEETLRNTYEITLVFDYLYKLYEGDKKLQPIQYGSMEYQHIKNKTIIKAELDILFQLGFEVYRLLDIPHRYFGLFLALFEKHPKYSAICQLAWKKLNDCYFTTVCLNYPHNIIAAAALYMAMRECRADFPQVPWWALMEAYQQAIQNIQIIVARLNSNSKCCTFQNVSSRIKQVSEANGITNGFPVPYYRKIMLENRGKFRIPKEVQPDQNEADLKANNSLSNLYGPRTQRKIVKIKQTSEPVQLCGEEIKKLAMPKQEGDCEIKKVGIDKKHLFESISKKLQKHQAVLNKPAKESSSGSDDEEMIAELKKKIKLNKEAKAQKQ